MGCPSWHSWPDLTWGVNLMSLRMTFLILALTLLIMGVTFMTLLVTLPTHLTLGIFLWIVWDNVVDSWGEHHDYHISFNYGHPTNPWEDSHGSEGVSSNFLDSRCDSQKLILLILLTILADFIYSTDSTDSTDSIHRLYWLY